jgi:transposase
MCISLTSKGHSSSCSCRLQVAQGDRADDCRTAEGSLCVLITGCPRQDLPREYGAPTTVWRRLKRWGEGGVWERMWRAALAALDEDGKLDWSAAVLDGPFVAA